MRKKSYGDMSDAEFSDGVLEDLNLLSARDTFRKEHNLLTSNEIRSIREKYKLSQSDLALILGWEKLQ